MTPPPVPECLSGGVPALLEVIDAYERALGGRTKPAGALLDLGGMLRHSREAIAHLAAAHDYEKDRPRAELEHRDLVLLREALLGGCVSSAERARLAGVLDEAITMTEETT
jgi:hypothetical protein